MGGSGPGAIVLFGSGETAAVGREALRWLAAGERKPASIVVLETPAGFEPNAEAVAARWSRSLLRQPEARGTDLAQLPLRRRGTKDSPDDADLARPILAADLIALGAGSPTYTVRQLRSSVAWEYARAAHLLGASFFLASAAALAVGTCSLPVYEIYKVGDDPRWQEGLGLFELYGIRLAIVTHWDDRSGGRELDTSRCFMGRERFELLLTLLPTGVTVLGIDEHTALAIDPATASATVIGRGGVTLIRGQDTVTYASGTSLALSELGPFKVPDATAVAPDLAHAIDAARSEVALAAEPPREVVALVRSRDRARAAKDFATADRLRGEIAERGWTVEDQRTGSQVVRSRN